MPINKDTPKESTYIKENKMSLENLISQITENSDGAKVTIEQLLLNKMADKLEGMKESSMKEILSSTIVEGEDIGNPGKNFEKIAKSAGKEYGSKEAGKRVAGAILKKVLAKESVDMIDEATRKDFQATADIVKTVKDPETRQALANAHAQEFAKGNPRFNHSIFHKACGTSHGI